MIERVFDWCYGNARILASEHPLSTCRRLRRFKKWLRSPERAEMLRQHAEWQEMIRARRDQRTHDRIMKTFLKRNEKSNVRH